MTTQTVHFDIEGKWFTWFLRHLWIEGSEAKALKTWEASFPDLCSTKHLKEYFLPIVSGKKKFTGKASDEQGFNLEDDNRKFWDPDQSEEENKHFPLLDSFEDVILLKKVRLYIAELELRSIKINRFSPSTFAECNNNSVEWMKSTEENKIENCVRRQINDYWTEIRNITYQSGLDPTLELLPTNFVPLKTGPTFKNKKDRKTIDETISSRDSVFAVLNPIKEYFHKKYGKTFYVFSEWQVEHIFELPDFVKRMEEEDNHQINKTKRAFGIKELPTKLCQKALKNKSIDAATLAAHNAQQILNLAGFNIDVNKHINDMIEDSHRDRLEPDDPETTKWESGYIDRDGKLYTCSNLDHLSFSEELCEYFGFKIKKSEEQKIFSDAQITLDEKGWVKISMNRFYWDYNKIKLTDDQKTTMFSYMSNKKMDKTLFNTSLPEYAKTLSEALKEYEQE